MCCPYRPHKICCNPAKTPDSEHCSDILPVTNIDRQFFSDFIGSSVALCFTCRVRLATLLTEEYAAEYLSLVSMFIRMTRYHEEMQNRLPTVEEVEEEDNPLEETIENEESIAEKIDPPPEAMSGIDLLLAAAEWIERNPSEYDSGNGQSENGRSDNERTGIGQDDYEEFEIGECENGECDCEKFTSEDTDEEME